MKFRTPMILFSVLLCSGGSYKGIAGEVNQMTYKKPSESELKKRLSPLQYQCTQEGATERPFENQYWNHHEDGVYVDIVTGEPLFSSLDKYDSGSGWPSFTQTLSGQELSLKDDFKLGIKRVEVRSVQGDSHLGHLFSDGPGPTGKRYCINSAAMNFVPVVKLEEHGLGRYLFLFAKKQNWEVATLAGGCFWGVEEILRKTHGVIQTQVGYTGGNKENVKYEDVKSGMTGHAEAVQVLFDPKKISYEDLLLLFFKLHDPTTINRQGNDVGAQYRSAIFYADEKQKSVANAVKNRVIKSGEWEDPVVTEVLPQSRFWRAEEEHQAYLKKKPNGYTCHFIRKKNF